MRNIAPLSCWIASVLVALVLACPSTARADVPSLSLDSPNTDHVVETDISTINVHLGSGDGNYTLVITVVGWDEQPMSQVIVPGVSGGWSGSVQIPTGRYGSYDVNGELIPAGGEEAAATAYTRVVRAVPVPALNQAQRADSCVGINTHIGTHWQTMGRFGIHWARHYAFGWLKDGSVAPRSTNGYDFEAIWNDAKAANVTILACMQKGYWNSSQSNYTSDTNYIRTAYKRIAEALPEITHWELDNEAWYNFQRKGTTLSSYLSRYRDYIHAAYQGLADAGGGRKVVMCGEAGIQNTIYSEMLRTTGVNPVVAGELDAVNYHNYWNLGSPEGDAPATNDILTANTLAHNAGKEAWFTEFGWTEKFDFGVGLRKQAQYMVRTHLIGRAWGVDKFTWFWDRDLDGTSWIATMGLIDIDNIARPLGPAFAAMSNFMAFSDVADSGDLGPDSWYVTFDQPDGSTLVTAWTKRDPQTYDASDAAAIYDIFGNRLPGPTVTLGPNPVYILYTEPDVNLAPSVYAGDLLKLYTPGDTVALAGEVIDDGEPFGSVSAQWSKVSGPGAVVFTDGDQPAATATFSAPGTYVLRLTADDGEEVASDDVTVFYLDEPAPQPLHGPVLAFDSQDLGDGLTGWTFWISNDDGYELSYASTLAFQGVGGATIRQMTFNGMPVNSETAATTADGQGDPPYAKAEDTWVHVPFCDNPIPGIHPLTGQVFSGIVEAANAYVFSCGTGTGSTLGDGVNVVHVVADGNVQWSGSIARNSASFLTTGVTDLPVTLLGDYNGDGTVNTPDYTTWADAFGWTGPPGDHPADGNNDGAVNTVDYVIWADNFGKTLNATLNVTQPAMPAVRMDGLPVSGGARVGDFNGDGYVNLADYTVWMDNAGKRGRGVPGDANGDRRVNRRDLRVWQRHFAGQ